MCLARYRSGEYTNAHSNKLTFNSTLILEGIITKAFGNWSRNKNLKSKKLREGGQNSPTPPPLLPSRVKSHFVSHKSKFKKSFKFTVIDKTWPKKLTELEIETIWAALVVYTDESSKLRWKGLQEGPG